MVSPDPSVERLDPISGAPLPPPEDPEPAAALRDFAEARVELEELRWRG